jgi:F420-dependent oxidoreductase-like protein
MKLSVSIGRANHARAQDLIDYASFADRLGVDYIWSAEAWGTDALTPLAYVASHTSRIRLGTGIMQISARAPSMVAMSALSMAALTENRFVLGLGASGPQVVEGLHGVDYAGPLTRLKETVEIVRLALRGEKLEYHGRYHDIPRPGGEGKALRVDHPPNPELPIFLATLGPRALEYTGAAADGWLGTSFSPDHAEAHFQYLRKGAESAGRTLADIELQAACTVALGDDVQTLIDDRKASVAFQMGAMGSANTNFYNDAFQRAGFVDDAKAIQALWIAGKRREAAQRVPDLMVTQFGAIGTADMVRERFRCYRDVGITCLGIRIDGDDPLQRMATLEQVVDIAKGLD